MPLCLCGFSDSLPAPPPHVVEFNIILSSTPVDLKRLSRVLDRAPDLAGQVIKLCNSSLFNLPNPVSSLEQAVVMLGTDQVRTLTLTCALVEWVGNHVAPRLQYPFWERGFLTAAVSEGLARRTAIPEVEMAYFGGLLHDIGTLPMLSASPDGDAPPDRFAESIDEQRELFAVDHCELGRQMGLLWNFPQPLLEVFELHHQPEKARDHRTLVGIVAIAEQFCRSRSLSPNEAQIALKSNEQTQNLWPALVPDLSSAVLQALEAGMESDYLQMSERLRVAFSEAFFRGCAALPGLG